MLAREAQCFLEKTIRPDHGMTFCLQNAYIDKLWFGCESIDDLPEYTPNGSKLTTFPTSIMTQGCAKFEL